MTTLHRAGRRADALAVYRRLHRLLVDEVGIEPGPSVQAVQARILSEDAAPRGVNQLPPGVPDLTGRDTELSIVDRLLAAAGSAGHPVLVQVTGPPGAGKSALAVTAAQRARGRFPDGQLYASLRGAQADPLDVLDAFLRALGADPDRIPDTLTGRSSLFRSLATGRRLLILLDDATSERQVHPLLPAHPGCAVVIISRILLPGLECMDYLRLDALRADKALELFGRIVGPARAAADSDTSREIVELCDRLPLAIRTAGARLAGRPHWPLRALASRLRDDHRRLDELAAGDLAVRTSITTTYTGLPTRSGSRSADWACSAGRSSTRHCSPHCSTSPRAGPSISPNASSTPNCSTPPPAPTARSATASTIWCGCTPASRPKSGPGEPARAVTPAWYVRRPIPGVRHAA